MMPPLVSIITPTLNQGRYIEGTLRSMREQSFGDFEHIVVDGGSSDDTLDILRAYEGTYLMRWTTGPDEGMYDAINKGLADAQGEILAYLNSDDQYLPWSLELAVAAFRADPDLGLVYGHAIRIDDTVGTIPWLQSSWNAGAVAAYGSIIQPTVFWRRSAFGGRAGFDSDLRFTGDLDMWLSMAPSARFKRVDEFLAIDHRHAESLSVAGEQKMRAEEVPMRKRYRRGVWATPIGPVLAQARSSLLRRAQWLRFVRSTRRSPQEGDPWARTKGGLQPNVATSDALLALVPGQGMRRMASVRWGRDPATLWSGDATFVASSPDD